MRKELEIKAIEILEASLKPLPHKKNELDWKADLSEKSDKLAQHTSAFANQPGGGFFHSIKWNVKIKSALVISTVV